MDEELMINADECYQLAEERASAYFHTLNEQLQTQNFVHTLTNDIHAWKHQHITSILSFFSRTKRKPSEYRRYLQWLNQTGKLEQYLDRSVSYIFLRDLGKTLNSSHTQDRVQRMVNRLRKHLTEGDQKADVFSMAGMYRMAQDNGVESAVIWMMNKVKNVTNAIPKGMDAVHARRKLIKIIAGVVMHELEEMDDGLPFAERAAKLDRAIRLGYGYGITYPFIDDLLDSDVLSQEEKKKFTQLIRQTLITGIVQPLGEWTGNHRDFITFIHSELRESFEYIKVQQHDVATHFFEQCYVFFQSQELDREKSLDCPDYTNEELFLPIILKSASSRLIVRSVISSPEDEDFDNRTFFYGLYNQLADDFADMFDDKKACAVTPYTYYMKYHNQRSDLINPFELYWTVLSYLIHHVYDSHEKTCDIMLDRAINGLKRFKEKFGTEKYSEIMTLFFTRTPKLNTLVQKMVKRADNVDFFDKLIRDHYITTVKNEQIEQDSFRKTIETVRKEVNRILPVSENDSTSITGPIVEAANYSLIGDGKRLRPIMTWVMAVDGYGLKQEAIIPLLRSLEYMHTASLIFDDLPTQDNASIRRGRATLHRVYNSAVAELTGLFLTQKAFEEQASLHEFEAKTVLKLIRYSARVTEEMCKGQAMDLDSTGKPLTLKQLNHMCFYKTGIAFEASLIMPAILAHANESEMEALKKFSYHAGIAFQIQDDLLDVEGSEQLLGKAAGKDAENNSSTFVSVLGKEEAEKAMWDHYCAAFEALQEVPRNTSFLKHLLDYIVNRDR